jgi:CheY-like chemotaxis protein
LNRTAEDCARLLEALPGDSDLRQGAEAIERAAMDAFAVTHRLRRFLEPPEVRPAQVLLNEVLSRLESAWKQIQPNLILRVEPDPVPVHADEWQLTRSLVSILLHARRRMTETSDLSVDTSSAVLEQMSHSARIRIVYTTRDEDAAALERVFEPSWSGDSNDLPVAYRIVKKMGGLIAARLEKGNTVTFDIYLSRASADAAGAPIPEPEKPAVLLIEPNPEVRRVLHLHFQRHGYKLLEAQDCEEGLLLANLYSAQIPLIVANPDNEDKARADLAEKLTAFRPESRVRLLAGYYESCRAAASSGMAAVGTRHLTKWDLLAWVQDAFASNAGDALA